MSKLECIQHDAMDCGPTSLKIIAQFYGKNHSLQSLRERCHISREGVSMLGISDAAEDIGFRTISARLTWVQLRSIVQLPCIIHWQQRHFVVVYKIKKRRGKWWIYVSDPAKGLLKYPESIFLKAWLTTTAKVDAAQERELESNVKYEQLNIDELSGNKVTEPCKENSTTNLTNLSEEVRPAGLALILAPTPKFYQEDDCENKFIKFSYLLQYLKPYKNYLFQLALAMLSASILSLILPFVTQAVVDKGIGTGNQSFVVIMLIAQVALVIGQMAINLLRSWLMLHMTTRISISLISDFLSKLLQLPIAFFDSKKVGDIMQRIKDYDRIQTFLTGSLLSMVMAAVSFIIYGVVMGGYNMTILLIFFGGSTFYIGWILVFMSRRRKLDYIRFQEESTNQNNIVHLINGMQDIKLNNCEKQKRWEWERIQARLFHISTKSLALNQTQEIGGVFIDQTKNILISFLAATSVIKGDMTLGMMVALQYIIGQLNAPLSQIIQFLQSTQDAKLSLERLSEIQEKENEEPVGKPRIYEIPDDADIEFKNVTFQYDGPHSAKALNDVSIKIPSNRVTAIVGASGSGKSTLLKMILGFYQPVGGEVLLAGLHISKYSVSCWRHACGTVMQEGYIFSDTIANNIGVSDEQPNIDRIKQAARIANIDFFIERLPLGYNTKIGADGHGLSVGQKQRLLIARAAYKNAKYLIFDEATNSLDANNEKMIMSKLEQFFKNKTVVVVAHRLSTVKNADNIIVLDFGRVAEQGTHNELIAKKGYYYELVKDQLELGN